MSDMFVGFAIDGYDTDKRVPVSTGRTRQEALEKAVTRVLVIGEISGSVTAVEQKEMDENTFDRLTTLLDDLFKTWGSPK